MGLEVGQNWGWLVPDEEGVHFLEVAQAGLIFIRVLQNLQAQGHQLLPCDLDRPLLLSFCGFLIGIEVEKPLSLALYTFGYLFLDLT